MKIIIIFLITTFSGYFIGNWISFGLNMLFPKFFAIVTRKSDSTVQFRVEDKDKGRARVQAMKKCFDQKYDDCTVALEGITDWKFNY